MVRIGPVAYVEHHLGAQAEEALNRVQERLDNTNGEPAQRRPSRPLKAAVPLEQVAQAVPGARPRIL